MCQYCTFCRTQEVTKREQTQVKRCTKRAQGKLSRGKYVSAEGTKWMGGVRYTS